MGCCKNINNNQENKQVCPLCSTIGNSIHYLAVEMVVKKDLISEVTKEQYFVCTNSNCDVVFYNQYQDRIFLVQDINMESNFKEITKSNGHECNSNCRNCNKN